MQMTKRYRARPIVSAVIPAYNAEALIREAIQSILDQTYEVMEIVVVDDGSVDRTAEAARGYPRTRVIQQVNAGPGAARNTGIRASTGEWIAFLDSDDVWVRNKVEVQLRHIAPDVGVIHCNRFDPIHFGNLWHRQAHVTPSGAMVRREALLEVGGFEESRSVMSVEDLNLWLKIALTGWRFVRSESNLFNYRPTDVGLSAGDLRMSRAELANIEITGQRVGCQPLEIERIRQASRIEYAKNLIAAGKWEEAGQLLSECTPGKASRWLSLAHFLKVNRLARTNLVRWLQSLDAQYKSHVCSGECNLPDRQRRQCMEACHTPYYRLPEA